MVGNWLAKTARVELTHFREFMGWIRYGENGDERIWTVWLIRRGWRVGFTLQRLRRMHRHQNHSFTSRLGTTLCKRTRT